MRLVIISLINFLFLFQQTISYVLSAPHKVWAVKTEMIDGTFYKFRINIMLEANFFVRFIFKSIFLVCSVSRLSFRIACPPTLYAPGAPDQHIRGIKGRVTV